MAEQIRQRGSKERNFIGRLSHRHPLVLLILVLASNAAFAKPPAPAPPQAEITVSAAISLKDVLEEIAQLYRAEKPQTTIRLNLAASGTLQLQIEEGAPVDVFISASPSQMDALESEGFILSDTRRDLVRNEVVLIVPKGKRDISRFQDLTRPEVKLIAVGEPRSVPAGRYAQEILTHFGIYDQLKPKFVQAQNVRQVLTFVATGNADAGVVYMTDALTSNGVAVAAIAPENSHFPVIYPIGVIRGSKNAAEAKSFEDFLLGPKAGAIFQKYGFRPMSHEFHSPRSSANR